MEFITLIFGAIILIGVIAVALWSRVLDWVRETLEPWVAQHLPELSGVLSEALIVIDRVVVAVRRTVIEAWRSLRHYLLGQTIEFERLANNVYVRKVTAYLRTHFEDHQTARRIVTEEQVAYEDLPDEIRASLVRYGGVDPLNFVRTRDEEIDRLELQLAI